MDLMSNIALKIMWVGCKGEIKDKSTQQEHPSKKLWKRLLKVFSSAIHKAEISHCVRGQMRKQLKALRKNIIGLSTCLWTFLSEKGKWNIKTYLKNVWQKQSVMFLHGLWLKCHFASDSKLRRKSEIATISRISFQCF